MLVMDICEIPNICGYILFEHRLHRYKRFYCLRLQFTSVRSRISVVLFLNTDCTDLRDITLTLVNYICEIPNICGYILFEHR